MHSLYVAALLRGAVENDSEKYFKSLFGFDTHARAAAKLRLVERGGEDLEDVIATPSGREFYAEHRLQELPSSAAAYWPQARDGTGHLERAMKVLDDQWTKMHERT